MKKMILLLALAASQLSSNAQTVCNFCSPGGSSDTAKTPGVVQGNSFTTPKITLAGDTAQSFLNDLAFANQKNGVLSSYLGCFYIGYIPTMYLKSNNSSFGTKVQANPTMSANNTFYLPSKTTSDTLATKGDIAGGITGTPYSNMVFGSTGMIASGNNPDSITINKTTFNDSMQLKNVPNESTIGDSILVRSNSQNILRKIAPLVGAYPISYNWQNGGLGLITTGTAGTYGGSSSVPQIYTDAWGRIYSVTPTPIAISYTAVTTSPAYVPTAVATATVVGTASTTPTITVNANGLVTGASAQNISIPYTSVTGINPAYVPTLTATNTGSVGSASVSVTPNINSNGQVISCGTTPILISASQVTGIGATAYTFTPTETFSVVAMNGGLSWNGGLGAITHITGPLDQTLKIVAGTPTVTTTTIAGNAVSISASNAIAGSTTSAANGGAVIITGGNGAANGAGIANGGAVTINAGNATGSNGLQVGGTTTLTGGTSAGGGAAAYVIANGATGTGGGAGGNLVMGGGSGAAAGSCTVTAGSINASSNNNQPGSVTILAGLTGGGSGTNQGGNINIISTIGHGNSGGNSGAGGDIINTLGAGGASTVSTGIGGRGGNWSVVGAAGGIGVSAAGGVGSTESIFAGLGGTGSPAGANGQVVLGVGTNTVVAVSTSGVTVTGSTSINSTQTTVSASTSGSAIFSEPEQGTSYKKCIIYLNAALGTASYTFPTAFVNTPVVLTTSGLASSIVTTLTTTSVIITGTTNTGFLIIEGY